MKTWVILAIVAGVLLVGAVMASVLDTSSSTTKDSHTSTNTSSSGCSGNVQVSPGGSSSCGKPA